MSDEALNAPLDLAHLDYGERDDDETKCLECGCIMTSETCGCEIEKYEAETAALNREIERLLRGINKTHLPLLVSICALLTAEEQE